METKLEAKSGVKNEGNDVFEKGKYATGQITVKASSSPPLPVDVFIVTPTADGTYPVVLFCHGWNMTNEWYSELFDHIASHGYIIVAPQFYSWPWDISITEEIKRANEVVQWLPTGLVAALEDNYSGVHPDDKLVVAGHSRGGKIAFSLALGEPNKTEKTTLKFNAVIGVDPVGGLSPQTQADPKILKYIPRCFEMSMPVALIGAGSGNHSQVSNFITFAPDGVNHAEFFNESKPPVCYFLAKEYGHFDMMNDNILLLKPFMSETSDRMRRATGGIMVAFLEAYLSGDEDDLKGIVDDPSIAPVLLDPVLYFKD